jgi:hypothetical protein
MQRSEWVDGKEPTRNFTPYQQVKNQPGYSAIKKQILNLLLRGEYDELTSYFSRYRPQEIEDFFNKEGRVIFSWSIINASDCQPLNFLIKTVPTPIVCRLLTDKDFSILNSFLGGQKKMENYTIYDETERELAIEKLKALTSIENHEINDFIDKNAPVSLKSFSIKYE